MRLITLILFTFISLSTLSSEEVSTVKLMKKVEKPKLQKVDIKVIFKPRVEVIPFSDIYFNSKIIKKEALKERLLKSGGDDVGNGGDEIRRSIIQDIQDMQQSLEDQLGDNYKEISINNLFKDINTKSIIVVDDLKINNIAVPGVATELAIILDRFSFESFKDHIDTRALLLELILIYKGHEENIEDLSIVLYSYLETRLNQIPFCHTKVSTKTKIIKRNYSQTISSKESSKVLSVKALALCEEKGLYECRIKETGYKGFSSWAKSYATYIGQEYKLLKKSNKELKSEECALLKKCEVRFDLAPKGQVSFEAYESLNSKIYNSCF